MCHSNNLKNLIGCPEEITKSLDCTSNNLESLEGLPRKLDSIWLPDHIHLWFDDLYTNAGVLKTEEEFEKMIGDKPRMAKYIVDLCSKKYKDSYAKTIKGMDQFDFFGSD